MVVCCLFCVTDIEAFGDPLQSLIIPILGSCQVRPHPTLVLWLCAMRMHVMAVSRNTDNKWEGSARLNLLYYGKINDLGGRCLVRGTYLRGSSV